MHHFFVTPEDVREKQIIITGTDVNHIKNVLRMKCGEELLVSDGQGKDYCCRIVEFSQEAVIADITEETFAGTELSAELYLFQGLPKSDKMEFIIQKAVELGVKEIIPVTTKRAVVKLDEKKAAKKTERWQAISESAAKQSRRGVIPQIHPVMRFEEALDYAGMFDVNLIPYENFKDMRETEKVLSMIRRGMKIGIFIGPEGGFDEGEVELAMSHKVHPISLGKRILRTETAGLAILSVLMFRLDCEE